MFRPVHFAAEEPAYKQLIEVLVPFEDQLKHKFCVTRRMLGKVICKIWKCGLSREMKESLRIFIQNNQQSILEHITALKENNDAVIIHRSLELQELFFESIAQVMIPYKELLALSQPMPHHILKIAADCLDGFHLGNSKTQSLQSYLHCNKVTLLRRISELNKKVVERNETSMPKMEVVVEIKGLNLVPSTFTIPLPTGPLISLPSSPQKSLTSSLQPLMSLPLPRRETSKPTPRTKTHETNPRSTPTTSSLKALQISRSSTPPDTPVRAHSPWRPMPSPPREPAKYNHWPGWCTKSSNSTPRTKTSKPSHRTKTPKPTHRTKTHESTPRSTPTNPSLRSLQIFRPATPPDTPSRAQSPRRSLSSPPRDLAMYNQCEDWGTKTPKSISRTKTHEPFPRPTPTTSPLWSLQISRPSTPPEPPSTAHSHRRPLLSPSRDPTIYNQWQDCGPKRSDSTARTKTPKPTHRNKTHKPILRPNPTIPSLWSLQISRPSTPPDSRSRSPWRPLPLPSRDPTMYNHGSGWSTKTPDSTSRTKTHEPNPRPTPTLPSLMSLHIPRPCTPPDTPSRAQSPRRPLPSPPRDPAMYNQWPGWDTKTPNSTSRPKTQNIKTSQRSMTSPPRDRAVYNRRPRSNTPCAELPNQIGHKRKKKDPTIRFRCWTCGGSNHSASNCPKRLRSSK